MTMARDATDMVNLRLRLPEELRHKLANEAEKANRSLNSEVLFRLTRSLGPEWGDLVSRAEERERQEQELIERMREDPKVQASLAKVIAELREKVGSRKKKDR
jgi:hypothetical protein